MSLRPLHEVFDLSSFPKHQNQIQQNQWLPTIKHTGLGRISPLSFSLMLILGSAWIAPSQAANIQADSSAPKNQQATILQTSNGLPQVNIQTPTAAGVSVNQYRQFDVDNHGAILNNSRRAVQTQQGAWIQANPWLATGEAKIIVNQVNSQNPSLLNGYVEVAGQKAEIILANPAGIQVNGGGFINTNGATLTTGIPFIRSGHLDGYAVQNGGIRIHGKGLNAKETDFTRLLSRYVEIDAPIWANDLQVVSGSNDFSATGQITQTHAANSQRAVAIDSSELGGMYANKISLITSNANERINHKGQIFAYAGGVSINANGELNNTGTIASQDTTQIQATALHNQGTLSSKEQFELQVQQLNNSGTVLATGEWNARVSDSLNNDSQGKIKAARLNVLAGNLTNAGTITQTGSQELHLESVGQFSNAGRLAYAESELITQQNTATDDVGGAVDVSDNTTSLPSSAVGTGESNIINGDNTITNFATGSLKTNGTFHNSGNIYANGIMDLIVHNGIQNNNELSVSKLSVLGGDLDNRQGKIDTQIADIQTNQWLNQQGEFQAEKQLSSKNALIDNTNGKIVSAGSVDLKSDTLLNNGTLSAKQNLNVDLKNDFTIERDLIAGSELNLQTKGNLNNTQHIQAALLVKLGAGQNIINRGIINSHGLTQVQATRTLDNVGTGQIYGDDVQISAQTLHNHEEKQADDTIKFATIAARNRLDIGVQNLVNQEHAILFSAGDLHIGGELNAQNQAAGVANDVKNLSATIEALGNGSISSRNLLNKNEHFTITPHVPTGEEQSFHEMSPESEPNRRIDMNLLKEVHFSRAGKWVFKNNREVSDDDIELGKTPIPNLFELKQGSNGEYLEYALYLPNHEAWAYFGIEPPQTEPPMLPEKAFNEPLPTGLKEEDCTADNSLCADYLAKEKAYEESIQPYSDWLNANQAAYDALSQKIEAYNQDKLGEEFKNFTIYNYTRRYYQDEVEQSDPAIIAVGGNLSLSGGTVTNDKSRIVVGKTLLGGLDKIDNIDAPAFKYQEDQGTSQYTKTRWRGGFKRYHQRDWDGKNDYANNLTTPIVLTIAEKSENTAINPTVETPQTALIEPATLTSNQAVWVTLPNSSLFTTNPQHHDYLIETNPQFADYRRWLGSDYMLNALKNDPNHTHKRLGDGFYEQRLLREQIVNLTGQRFLDGYSNDEEQFKSLMNNGVTFAQSHNLRVGIALSAEQMAHLTSDIVWLEYQHVKLPNGTVEQVLVPKVYVVPRSGDLKDTGALIAAQDLKLDVSGNLKNTGTLNARNVMVLNAENVEMLGEAQGKTVAVSAQKNVDITGGQIRAQDGLSLQAAGDININSTTSEHHVSGRNFTGSNTNLARVAGLYVTGDTGSLAVSADNIRLAAAVVDNVGSGDVVLAANQSLQIGSLETSHKRSTISDANNYLIEGQSQEIGSQINGKGNVHLQSKGSTEIRASQINSEMGQLSVSARDLQVVSGEKRSEFAESHLHKHKGVMGSSSRERRYEGAQTESLASTLTGKTVVLNSETDIRVSGSQIISDEQTNIVAKGDVRLEAAENRQSNHTYSKDSRSGVMGTGGIGVFIGSKKTTDEQDNTSLTHTASTVGSLKGNTTIVAGQNYAQTGSIVRSVEGNNLIAAQKIDVKAAENRYTNDHIHTQKQSGATVAVNAPVVQLAQSALAIADNAKQVGQSKNDRVNAMAAANTAWQAYETHKSAKQALSDPKAALTNISATITYGKQKSHNESHRTATEAQSSLVQSGGKSTLIATGAGTESDINITGSDVLGGKGTYLFAEDAINLTSAQQHSTENSNNKSSGWNVGGSVGSQGWGVTAGGNKGKGHGNGESLTHRHTHVGDSNSATVLQSGGQTTIKGAQVHGKGIDLSAKDLQIESVQDTAKFNSKQENISGQVTIGGGASVSGSYNKSKVNADHASVNQQSGLYAGDDGYRAHVTKHTDLRGALITSTQSAEDNGKNQFSTHTLSHSDIENHSDYNAKGIGVSGGLGFNADFGLGDKAQKQSSMKATDKEGNVITDANGNAQLATGKASVQSKGKAIGYGSDGESESSVTRSGINTQNIQIQQAPTGELAKSVYTDITTETAAQHSGSLKNSFDKDKVQQEIDLQVKVSQDFNSNGQSALAEINTKVKSHLDAAKALEKQVQEAEARGDIAQAAELDKKAKDERQSADNWQNAGVGLNMLISGLSAPTESMAGIATATLAPAASYRIGQYFKQLAEENKRQGKIDKAELTEQQKAAHVLAHAVLGAAVAATGGNDAMAGALSAGGAEAIAPVVSSFMYGTNDPEKLTAEQKETIASISSLAGAGVGVAIGNSATNAVQGSLNAENAVENNFAKIIGYDPMAMNEDDVKRAQQIAIDRYAAQKFNGNKEKAKQYIDAYNAYVSTANSQAIKDVVIGTLETIKHPIDSSLDSISSLYDVLSNPKQTYQKVVLSYKEWQAIYNNALIHDIKLAAQMDATMDAVIGSNVSTILISRGTATLLTESATVAKMTNTIGNLWKESAAAGYLSLKVAQGANKYSPQQLATPQSHVHTTQATNKAPELRKPLSTCENPPACFIAGTLIQTVDGLKPIEQIQRGDLVWSRQEFGDAYAYKPVFETKVTENQQLYEVVVENASGETETYLTTAEHPFYIADLGWLKASLLEVGMPLLDRNGNSGSLKVKSQTKLERWEAVYNFEVGEFATYHIGHLGVWVHNANCCEIATKAPVTETKRGVISPTKLKNGSIDLDVPSTSKTQVDDIVKNGDIGGNKTEDLFEDVVKHHGGTVLAGGKYGSNNGYDHVVVFKDTDGKTYLTMTVDSKQLNTKGVKLDHNAAGGTMQMSDAWDREVLPKLDKSSDARQAIETAKENGSLVKAVAYVDKQTGQLKLVRIDPKTPSKPTTPKPKKSKKDKP